MRPLRLLLATFLIAQSGAPLWAGETRYEMDGSGHIVATTAAQATPGPAGVTTAARAAIARVEADARLSADQKAQFKEVITRYERQLERGDPDATRTALDKLVTDLNDPSKKTDPGLALAAVFDRLAESTRRADTRATYLDTRASPRDGTDVVTVGNSAMGRTLFVQQTNKLSAGESLRTIRRPLPDNPKQEQIEAIIYEVVKGGATEQRIVYNRQIHDLLSKLRKTYYDQCDVVRKVNNGEEPPWIAGSGCKEPSGHHDPQLTDDTRKQNKKLYLDRRGKFPKEILAYLEMLDGLKAQNKLGDLKPEEWKRLEEIQRIALTFYNDNQLETYQRSVIQQLTGYLSMVTNSSPKQKKGEDQVDVNAKKLKEFQDLLDGYKKGDLDQYTNILKWLGFSKLDENSKEFIRPEIMETINEAFADVAAATKAQAKLLSPGLSGQEKDAYIEEASNWLRLAQIQIQTFDMQTQAIQLSRLAQGQVRGIGIDYRDEGMIKRAQELAAVARGPYLEKLRKVNADSKGIMLKQTIAGYYILYVNAAGTFLYSDTLHERLLAMSAKVNQMLELYLSLEFEKVRVKPENKAEYMDRFTAAEKVQAGAYRWFLTHLPDNVRDAKRRVEAFKAQLDGLGQLQSIEAIRQGLLPMRAEFKELVELLTGLKEIPSPTDLQKEAQKQATEQSGVFKAVGNFGNNMRLFDSINELEVYVTKYASDESTWSRSDTIWTQFSSFDWYNKHLFSLGGASEAARDKLLARNTFGFGTAEAYEKLKANKAVRKALMDALRDGKFAQAQKLAAELDPKHAKWALEQAKLDKIDDDPTDLLDFDGLMGKQYDNDLMTAAMGATTGRFGMLNRLMLGYAAATAVVNSGITVVATSVLGPVISVAMRAAGETLVAMGTGFNKWAQVAQAGAATSATSRLVAFSARLARWPVSKVFLEYPGKVFLNAEHNLTKTLALPAKQARVVPRRPFLSIALTAVDGIKALPGQIFLGQTWINSIRSTVSGVLVMGGVSGLQSAVLFDPTQGQHENRWEAFYQGAIMGAAFGAGANLLFAFTPLPASAFSGRFGSAMNTAANVNGPISGALQWVYRASPGLAATKFGRAMAEGGLFGAVANYGLKQSAGWNTLVRSGTWGLGMLDGTLKFYLAAEVPRQVVQLGTMVWGHLFGDSAVDPALGATPYVARLANAQINSMTISQVAWLFMPQNPAFSPREIRDQVREQKGMNALVNDPLKLREATLAPKGKNIELIITPGKRSVTDWLAWVGGKVGLTDPAPRTYRLVVSEGWSLQAWTARIRGNKESKGWKFVEALGLALAPSEGNGELVKLGRLVKVLGSKEEGERLGKDLAGVASEGRRKAGEEALEVRRLFIKDSKGNRVEATAEQARWVAPPDAEGYVEVKDPKTGKWVRNGDASIHVEEIHAGHEDDVRLTNESKAAARMAVERMLTEGTEGPARREKILMSKDSIVLDGVRIEGKPYEELKRIATLVHLDNLPAGSNLLSASRDFVSRSKDMLLDRKVATPQQRFGKVLADETLGRAERTSRSAPERAKVVGEQIAELIRITKSNAEIESADARALTRVRAALDAGRLEEAKAELVKAADAKIGPDGALKDGGLPQKTFNTLERMLKDEGRPQSDRVASVKQEIGDFLKLLGEKSVTESKDIATLENARSEIAAGRVDRAKEILTLAGDAKVDKKTGKIIEAGVPKRTYETLGHSLEEGQLTADLISSAASSAVAERINRATGADKEALLLLRQSLEGDAARQAVIELALRAFKEGTPKEIGKAIDLYIDIFERGVFGQMFGEQVKKVKNEKVTYDLVIPSKRQFKNRFGNPIPGFRDLQRRVIKEALTNVAEGYKLNFGQMPTSGGKTLTNFVLIEFLDAHARRNGKEGVIYLTTNPDLVAQATADYIAFFGKKPGFEIMTYGDVSARIAQALSQGMPSPLNKFYLVADEGDKPASEVPTSVGVFNGVLSMSRLDPIQLKLTELSNRFVKDKDGFYLKHADRDAAKRITEGVLDQNGFMKRLGDDKAFREDFRKLVKDTARELANAEAKLRSEAFRKSIDLTIYPEYAALYGDKDVARTELQRTMIAEWEHAKLTANLLHGSLEKRLERFFLGGYEFAGEFHTGELSTKVVPDKDPRRGVINFNNGIAYDNLSTPVGPFASSFHGRPISNEFESAGVLNFRGLVAEAMKTGTVFFATSGTAAAKIRRILIEDFHFRFMGEISIADPVTYAVLGPGSDWKDIPGSMKYIHGNLDIRADASVSYALDAKAAQERFEQLKRENPGKKISLVVKPGAEKTKDNPERIDKAIERDAAKAHEADLVVVAGGPNLVFKFAHTLPEGRALYEEFSKVTDPNRISVLVEPGSALYTQDRYDKGIKDRQNLAAYERGDVEVIIVVGWAGLRGLEANLKQYGNGRTARMDILDPQMLPTEELTQLVGRLADGRAGMLDNRTFRAIIRPESLLSSETALNAAPDFVGRLRGATRDAEVEAATTLLKSGELKGAMEKAKGALEKAVADGRLKSTNLTAGDILAAVLEHDKARAATNGAVERVPEDRRAEFERKRSEANPVWYEVILPTLKNPRNLETGELVATMSEVMKIKTSMTPAEIKDLSAKLFKFTDPQGRIPSTHDERVAARKALLPYVSAKQPLLEVLTAAMGRVEQDRAISSSGILDRDNLRPDRDANRAAASPVKRGWFQGLRDRLKPDAAKPKAPDEPQPTPKSPAEPPLRPTPTTEQIRAKLAAEPGAALDLVGLLRRDQAAELEQFLVKQGQVAGYSGEQLASAIERYRTSPGEPNPIWTDVIVPAMGRSKAMDMAVNDVASMQLINESLPKADRDALIQITDPEQAAQRLRSLIDARPELLDNPRFRALIDDYAEQHRHRRTDGRL